MRVKERSCGGREPGHSHTYSYQIEILSRPIPEDKGGGGADLLGGVAYMLFEHDMRILLVVRVVKDVDPVRLCV